MDCTHVQAVDQSWRPVERTTLHGYGQKHEKDIIKSEETKRVKEAGSPQMLVCMTFPC